MSPTELEMLKFLKVLQFHLSRGKRAYHDYMENGKLFKYAIIIKNNNLLIHNMIMREGYLLPSHLEKQLIDIISHIDMWLIYWNDLKGKLTPDLNDEFIFDNDFSFPKKSERALMGFMSDLIKLKAPSCLNR